MNNVATIARQTTAVACIAVVTSVCAFGWSVEGHQAIALIAASLLKGSHTADRISALLGPGVTLADIAVCPDQVRALEEHHTPMGATCKSLFPVPPTGTGDWHFVDTPIKEVTFNPKPADVTAACAGDCVLVQIPKFLAVLKAAKPNDTAAQKLAEKQALSFVVHFIGDVHQPLHAADRGNDHGGNAEHVTFFNTDEGGDLVLHGIWDRQIVSKVASNPTALANALTAEINQASAETQTADPMDWALQSYKFARDVAYKGVPPAPTDPAHKKDDVATLGQPYQDKAAPPVRIQIARGGVRLAAALKVALP